MARTPDRRTFLAGLGAAAIAGVGPWPSFAATEGKPGNGSSGLEYRSASELGGMLADKRVSAAELVDFSIARIEALDGRINAVVVRDFERARAAAKEADAALARGERRPLLGLPMTVKEQFNIAGLPTTWGDPKFRDWRPESDALTVQRLKAAGAVIIGKTNVPLGLRDWQSYKQSLGPRPHPWRIIGRCRRRARRRVRHFGTRLGHRRVAAGARSLLRRVLSQTELGSRPPTRRRPSGHPCGTGARRSLRDRPDGP